MRVAINVFPIQLLAFKISIYVWHGVWDLERKTFVQGWVELATGFTAV